MRVSAKADYALRAVIELAATADSPVKGELTLLVHCVGGL
jgi:DNA-binding IscR family transcriptional regulator